MTLKLGSTGECPITGAIGFLTKFIGGVPIYRAADGTLFKGQSRLVGRAGRPAAAGKRCRIRIKGVPGEWLEGVMVTKRTARVLSADRVWHGAVVSANDAEITSEVGNDNG